MGPNHKVCRYPADLLARNTPGSNEYGFPRQSGNPDIAFEWPQALKDPTGDGHNPVLP